MVGWSGVSNCRRSGAGRRRRRVYPFPRAPRKPRGPREPRFLLVSQQNFRLVPSGPPELLPCLFLSVFARSVCLSSPGSYSLRGFAARAGRVHTCHVSALSRFPPHSGPKATPAVWRPALSCARSLRRANCPELSPVLAASGRGARGIGDSQAWHLCFLRERQLALPWPCGPRESVAGIAAFSQVPTGVPPQSGFGMGFNFSW